MGSSYQTLLLITFFFFLGSISFGISLALGGKTLDDDWKPINNLKDPQVVGIGEFAVTTYNKRSQSSLVFDSLVGGETKSDGGTNYKLTIGAKDGNNGDDTIRDYVAVVIDRPFQNYLELISFTGPIN